VFFPLEARAVLLFPAATANRVGMNSSISASASPPAPPPDDDRPSRLWLILSPRVALRRVFRELCERFSPASPLSPQPPTPSPPSLPPESERPSYLLLWERTGAEFFLPPELVRIVASFAPAPAKLAMERSCKEWRAQVLPRHWVNDLRALFGIDYGTLRPAGRPEPKRLFALLETARRDLGRVGGGGRRAREGSGVGGARTLVFTL
jgi:hypothetical protein